MRKVTREIGEAFKAGKPKTVANTTTDGHSVFLHGNKIAQKQNDSMLALTLAGWGTVTTRERLNGILDTMAESYYPGGFTQSKGEQYFRGCLIDANDTVLINVESGEFEILKNN